MKKAHALASLILACLLLAPNVAKALSDRVSLGAQFGFNRANLTGTSARYGYQGGLTIDYQFTHNYYILSAIQFSVKGAKQNKIEKGGKWKSEPVYIQVPIHAAYKFHIDGTVNLVFSAGPYFAYGIAGNTKYEIEKTGVNGQKYIEYDKQKAFSKTGFKRFDVGVGLTAGVEIYKCWNAMLGYNFGLRDIGQTETFRSRNLYMAIGYKF